MGVFERRIMILEYLSRNRQTTYDHLVNEFEVSKSTIREDVQALIDAHLPIEKIRGRYGGIKVSKTFHFYGRPMTARQIDLLKRISLQLKGEDAEILQGILYALESK